jgi:hypothetical protein
MYALFIYRFILDYLLNYLQSIQILLTYKSSKIFQRFRRIRVQIRDVEIFVKTIFNNVMHQSS